MRHNDKIICLSLLIAIWISLLTNLSLAGIRIDFDRDNKTYNWLAGFNYKISKDNFELTTIFDGRSNLIKSDINRWQESATTGFETGLSMFQRMKLKMSGGYTVNGLNQKRVKTSELKLGISYKPIKLLEIKPVIRGDNKQRSEIDRRLDNSGLGYGLTANLSPGVIHGINLNGSLSYDKVNLSNIPSQTGAGYLNLSYDFSESDTVSFSINALEATKKYYGSNVDQIDIVKQIKQQREARLLASVSLPANLRLRRDGNANLTRFLYRGGLIEEQGPGQRDNSDKTEGYVLTLIGRYGGILSGYVDYKWSAAGQDYRGNNLDQDTDIGELSFHGSAKISDSDSVKADIVLGVTSFTNPSIDSDRDDWDKKTLMIHGRYRHTFNRYFAAGLSGGANVFHQIYISGTRSANNGKNDTYIMTPFSIWRPFGWLKATQTFDIQANYITFDFDRKRVATKNRIFRRATSRSDFEIEITENLYMTQSYYYRYEDYGQLIWDDGWQQAVSWDRRRNGIETKFDYSLYNHIRISPLFMWEKTGEYDHEIDASNFPEEPEEIRLLGDEQVKLYYSTEIGINWSAKSRMTVSISHRVRKFNNRPRETNNYANVSMEYLF